MRYIQCKKCYHLTKISETECEACGSEINKKRTGKGASIHMFPTGVWEHLAEEPIYIKGREHLRSVCADLPNRATILD